MSIANNHAEALLLQIKKEEEQVKKDIKPGVMDEMRDLFDKCFMMPKSKKEHFITREKLQLDMLKLLQRQKKFKPSDNIFNQIRYLAVFDKKDNVIGRLIDLNMIDMTASFITYFSYSNNKEITVKSFKEIELFDYNSIAMEFMYNQQANFYGGLSYTDTYRFLTGEDIKITKQRNNDNLGYGVEVIDTENHPVLKEIVEQYNVPVAENKEKRKLLKLNSTNLEVIEVFLTVKEAADKLEISASTISNVLCQGKSAQKYTEAGNFKWAYSDQPNLKYQKKA